eukprot:gnl/Trimastix_PCT/3633.p1 GENE.gnl/Trimastix_PCT/3633~~gnl/Trimastix_PCT/3633.p1  ORF type:complete len:283 (+),score=20.13 gnl/Trimastix_PCT/3633:274-1122(+)
MWGTVFSGHFKMQPDWKGPEIFSNRLTRKVQDFGDSVKHLPRSIDMRISIPERSLFSSFGAVSLTPRVHLKSARVGLTGMMIDLSSNRVLFMIRSCWFAFRFRPKVIQNPGKRGTSSAQEKSERPEPDDDVEDLIATGRITRSRRRYHVEVMLTITDGCPFLFRVFGPTRHAVLHPEDCLSSEPDPPLTGSQRKKQRKQRRARTPPRRQSARSARSRSPPARQVASLLCAPPQERALFDAMWRIPLETARLMSMQGKTPSVLQMKASRTDEVLCWGGCQNTI